MNRATVYGILGICLFAPLRLAADEREILFSRDILPILSDHCYQCHGPDSAEGRQGDLRLDQEEDVYRERDGIAVIVPHEPEHSELYRRVVSADEGEQMPPPELGRSLSDDQKRTLQLWIAGGAEWGRHWAFEPILPPSLTDHQSGGRDEAEHPIDVLVRQVLREKGWSSNPPADRRTLIRRLSLDLRGLPPTPDEVAAFVESEHPQAWEQVVDSYLASSAFGERMAWDWMEVARYADSNGYQGDGERTMWPWRDWVVAALNDNLPFDQFTLWQVAGDLLPDAKSDQVLATGFCRNHMINGEGGRIPEENRVDYVMDMTETVGTAWLGLTLNCCRCHDHKFDPLLNKEYYQLTAFFNQTPVDGGGGNPQTPPLLTAPSLDQQREEQSLHAQVLALADKTQQRRAELESEREAWIEQLKDSVTSSPWTVFAFHSMTSLEGQQFAVAADGVLTATPGAGKADPARDDFELSQRFTRAQSIGMIWLEAVRDERMSDGGFARSGSGNFVLTRFDVRYRHPGQEEWKSVAIAAAKATFEQGDLSIAAALDESNETGWGVYEGKPPTRNHSALFQFAEKIEVLEGTEISVTLRYQSPHDKHVLCSFRLAYGESPAFEFPDALLHLADLVRVPAEERTESQRELLRRAHESNDPVLSTLGVQLKESEGRLASLRNRFPKVMVMADQEARRPTFVLVRGLYNEPGEEVSAATPAFLPPFPQDQPMNRLGLARWLIASENPLTARVVVNRFWQMFFGMGLVKTAEDFGVQAEYPIQRELLDYLAWEFRQSGWDVKKLVRFIVTSDTYRQSSHISSAEVFERDPDNRYLARGARYRLPSWMIRDSALSVSGLLSDQVGGPPVFPYQPEGVWSEATFGTKTYQPDQGSGLYRRSLYTFWRRIVGPTLFFDAGKRQVCEVKQLRTNTPLHALTTLNDITYVEAARMLAAEVIASYPEKSPKMLELRLEAAYLRLLGRNPVEDEISIWRRSLEKAEAHFLEAPEAAQAFLQVGGARRKDAVEPAELAAWGAVVLKMMNLDEFLTRE